MSVSLPTKPAVAAEPLAVVPPNARPRRRRQLGIKSLLLITTAILTVLVFVPLLFVVIGAISEDPAEPLANISFRALADAYLSPTMLVTLLQTLALAVGCGFAATAIGGTLAWIVARIDLPFQRTLDLMVTAPLFISPFLGAMAWVALAAPRSGILNIIADDLGLPGVNVMTPAGVVIVLVLYYVPYGYQFTSGTLKNMDASLEEASQVNGRNVLQTALRVSFPLIRTSLLSSVIFIAILATGMFSVPAILGVQSNFRPLAVEIYRATSSYPSDYALAASIGTMLVLLSIGALMLYQRTLRKASRYVTVSGKARQSRNIDAGWMKYPLLAVFGTYGLLALFLPIAALVVTALTPFAMRDLSELTFTLDNVTSVLSSPELQGALGNTAITSTVTALACIALGLLTVYVTERQKIKGAGIVSSLAMAPLAVPGIVFGTGVLWLYVRTPLYATLAVMVVAFVANYLPHAVRVIGNGLTQIDSSLEEASAVCGASRGKTIRTILVPLIRPSVMSAGVLVFIFTVREINTSIMLYSPNTQLLSILAFNYTEQGSLASASVVGLLEMLFMISVVLIAKWAFGVKT